MTEAPMAPFAALSYTLSAADALAYERLPREFRGLQTLLFYGWMGLAGFPLAALPESVAGPTWGWRFFVYGAGLLLLQYLLFRIGRDLLRRNRARHRYPRPVAATLQQGADHLVVTEGGKRRTIPYTEIGMLLPGPAYLFMAAGPDLVIVPTSAFGDGADGREGMLALTEAIDSFMRDHYDAEAAAEAGDDPDDAGPPE